MLNGIDHFNHYYTLSFSYYSLNMLRMYIGIIYNFIHCQKLTIVMAVYILLH